MSIRFALCTAAFLSIVAPQNASAVPLANSVAEFSSTQGSDNWFYGFYNQSADASPPYSAGDFVQFADYDAAVQTWKAAAAQLTGSGPLNNFYLGIDAGGGHPTGIFPGEQDIIVWAMRRYVSETAGQIDISIDAHRINNNPNGNGITARVFVDGIEIYSAVVAGIDLVGIQTTLLATVAVGSTIDFAIDPTGAVVVNNDDIASPRADGSHFSALISTHEAPIPSTAVLLLAGLGILARRRSARG